MGMTQEDRLKFIAEADYPQLLRLWRFEPYNSPWFHGEVGKIFTDALKKAREEAGPDAPTVSKSLGWSR